MFCGKCGFKLPDNSKFCSCCGTSLQSVKRINEKLEVNNQCNSFPKNDNKIQQTNTFSPFMTNLVNFHFPNEDYSLKINSPQKWYLPYHTFKELNNLSGRSTRKDYNICTAYFILANTGIDLLHIWSRELSKTKVKQYYTDYYGYRDYHYVDKYNYGNEPFSIIVITITTIFMLYLLYKFIKVQIRRAHDLGISGERVLVINLLPSLVIAGEHALPFAFLGGIIAIFWWLPLHFKLIFVEGDLEKNQYGINPLLFSDK